MPGGLDGVTGPDTAKTEVPKKSPKHSTMGNKNTSLSVMHCFIVTPCGGTRLIVWVCLPHVKAAQEQSNGNMKLLYFYTYIISSLSFLPLKDMKNLQGNKLQDTRIKGWRTHMGQPTEEASANWKVGDPAGSGKNKNKKGFLQLGKGMSR